MARLELTRAFRRGLRALSVAALACAIVAPSASPAASAPPSRPAIVRAPECRGRATPSIDALQLLELQISYTTLLARYYEPVDPAAVVRGAHAGAEALLKRCGVVDRRTVHRNARQEPSERIDTDFLTAIATYGRRIDAGALLGEMISGELSAMHDPYTLLFRPAAYKSFNTFLQGDEFGGVGLVLDASHGRPRVATVIPNAPAERAGVRAGDVIAAIDGTDTQGRSVDRLRDLLRGKPGSVAHLTISRDPDTPSAPPATLRLDVTREIVRDPQTLRHLIGTDVGYVQLTRFGDGAADEVARAVADLETRGAKRFVLDLRDNGGGYGDAATGVVSIFVPTGTVYTTRERGGPQAVQTARPGSAFRAPLAVLVNHNTASAAEIVAGALQDDRAATIVGVTTFGKGVVQSVYPLPDGAAIKMTTARYFTPSGRSIDHVGIVPDVVVPEPSDAHLGDPARDPQLARALELLATGAATASPQPSGAASPLASP